MEYLQPLWTCLMIAIAASSIAITITQTEVFAPLRALTDKMGHMISYLFKCFYCMTHWIVFVAIILYQPRLVHSAYLIVDLTVTAFVTIALATFSSALIFKSFLVAMAMKVREKEVKEIFSQK